MTNLLRQLVVLHYKKGRCFIYNYYTHEKNYTFIDLSSCV
jgi:mRNA-degrading endonuclease HigB of HigAB toxin-antitoxin module